MTTLTTAQRDRACGVLLGTAAGDALGAAYEFGPPRGPELEVAMVGGGGFGWEPGEWTDDTSMAIAIAEVAATGADLREEEALDALTRRWHEWSKHAKDVGVQTRSVLSRAGQHGVMGAVMATATSSARNIIPTCLVLHAASVCRAGDHYSPRHAAGTRGKSPRARRPAFAIWSSAAARLGRMRRTEIWELGQCVGMR